MIKEDSRTRSESLDLKKRSAAGDPAYHVGNIDLRRGGSEVSIVIKEFDLDRFAGQEYNLL